MTNRRWLQGLVIAVLVLQWFLAAVPNIDAEDFVQFAQEVDRSGRWRYGIVSGRHESWLVKTRVTADAPPFVPPAAADEFSLAWAHELHARPWKVVLELGFYVSLWALWRLVITPWRRRFSGADTTRGQRCTVRGLSWIAMSTAMLAPYLVASYGLMKFGSGYERTSDSVLMALSGAGWGPAVTYKFVLFSILGPPLLALSWTGRFFGPFLDLIGDRAALWLACAVFYGVAGVVTQWIVEKYRDKFFGVT